MHNFIQSVGIGFIVIMIILAIALVISALDKAFENVRVTTAEFLKYLIITLLGCSIILAVIIFIVGMIGRLAEVLV